MTTPLPPVNPLVTLQPITTSAVSQNTSQIPNVLADVAVGTVIEGFVINRDANQNPILRTPLGDILVKSDIFLKTGSEVHIRVDGTVEGRARIINIDGLSPQQYADNQYVPTSTRDRVLIQEPFAQAFSQFATVPSKVPLSIAASIFQLRMPALLLSPPRLEAKKTFLTATLPDGQTLREMPTLPAPLARLTAGSPLKLHILYATPPEESLPTPITRQVAPAPSNITETPRASTMKQAINAYGVPILPLVHGKPVTVPNPATTPSQLSTTTTQPETATSQPSTTTTMPAPIFTTAARASFTPSLVPTAQNMGTIIETRVPNQPVATLSQAPAPPNILATVSNAISSAVPTSTKTADTTPVMPLKSSELEGEMPIAPTTTAPPAARAPSVTPTNAPVTATAANVPNLTPAQTANTDLVESAMQLFQPSPSHAMKPAAPTPNQPLQANLSSFSLQVTTDTSSMRTAPVPIATPIQLPENTVIFRVIGQEPSGESLLQSAIGQVRLLTKQPLPVGSTVVAAVTLDMESAARDTFVLPDRAITMTRIGSRLEGLEEALTLWQTAGPQTNAWVQNVLPSSEKPLNSGLLFFLSALKQGDISTFLPKTLRQIIQEKQPNLLPKLQQEFVQLTSLGRDQQQTLWNVFLIPLLHAEHTSLLQLAIQEHPTENKKAEDQYQRFILDIHYDVFGPLQLDGFVKKRPGTVMQFDLQIRTEKTLPAPVMTSIQQLFEQGLKEVKLRGTLVFQTGSEHFVRLNTLGENPTKLSEQSGWIA